MLDDIMLISELISIPSPIYCSAIIKCSGGGLNDEFDKLYYFTFLDLVSSALLSIVW